MNNRLHGFVSQGERLCPEIAATAEEYRHEKSGARLLLLASEEKNRAFCIGFRTPPEDSTGVAHIIEHSVLAGSEKYRVREPFMAMLKTSMQTFLNAMTFDDMTLYPFSSLNEQDFLNLMDVYMDAVFNPLIYSRKNVFLQEGWHLEMADEEAPLKYNGVVYNEMRGAYDDPVSQFNYDLERTLHPGSTYSRESGGYPYDIPHLSYEKFLAFHKKHYHPSNALIVLFGDIDREKSFAKLDSFLSAFDAKADDIEIEKGTLVGDNKDYHFTFNGEVDEKNGKDNWLSIVWTLGHIESVEDTFLLNLARDVLVDSDSAPIKLALQKAGIGDDIMSYGSSGYFSTFGVVARGVHLERKDEFFDIVTKTLRKAVAEGIDKDLILAQMNSAELDMREAKGALRGIIYAIRSMGRFRYREDLLADILFDAPLKKLRQEVEGGIFESFIAEKILPNPHFIRTVHSPDADFFRRKDEEVTAALKAEKAAMSETEKKELIAQTKELIAWQSAPEDPAALAALPYLRLADISPEVTHIPEERIAEEETEYLLHVQPTGGLGALSFSFDLSRVAGEELFYLGCLAAVLGRMDTRNLDYIKLNNEIEKAGSGFSIRPLIFDMKDEPERYVARLGVRSYAVDSSIPRVLELLQQVFMETDFSSEQRLREILTETKANIENAMDGSPNYFAMMRAASSFDEAAAYSDTVAGIGFYHRLAEELESFGERADTLIAGLQKVRDKVITRHNAVVSMVADENSVAGLYELSRDFMRGLPTNSFPETVFDFAPARFDEGFYKTGNVNYVARAGRYQAPRGRYEGNMAVLENLITNEYLYAEIRAKGGAYGQNIAFKNNGIMNVSSYRDPHLSRTLDVYNGIADWVGSLAMSQADLERIITGTLTRFDPARSPLNTDGVMLARYHSGRSERDLRRLKEEAMRTTVEELRAYAGVIESAVQRSALCVIGSETDIRVEAHRFGKIAKLKR